MDERWLESLTPRQLEGIADKILVRLYPAKPGPREDGDAREILTPRQMRRRNEKEIPWGDMQQVLNKK